MYQSLKIFFFFTLCLLPWLSGHAQKVEVDLEEQYQKGILYMRTGQYEKAIDPLYECYREDSKNLVLANQIAYCYLMANKTIQINTS